MNTPVRIPNGGNLWNLLLSDLKTQMPGQDFIIAGGAVRDFLLKVEAKDIDIYTNMNPHFGDFGGFQYLGPAGHPRGQQGQADEYEHSNRLMCVSNYTAYGWPVQVMELNTMIMVDPFGKTWQATNIPFTGEFVAGDFNIDISKCWYDGIKIRMAPEALDDMNNKRITLRFDVRPDRQDKTREKGAYLAQKLGFKVVERT